MLREKSRRSSSSGSVGVELENNPKTENSEHNLHENDVEKSGDGGGSDDGDNSSTTTSSSFSSSDSDLSDLDQEMNKIAFANSSMDRRQSEQEMEELEDEQDDLEKRLKKISKPISPIIGTSN